MSIENTAPSVTTSPMLVSDTVKIQGGSQDAVQPSLSKNSDGETVSAAFEVKSSDGGILAPRLTKKAAEELTVLDGLFYYNSGDDEEDGQFEFIVNGEVIPLGMSTGDVIGPTDSVINNIATFADDTGTEIQDSGVPVGPVSSPVPHILNRKSLKSGLSDGQVNEIGNLGHIKFVDGIGLVFVDTFVGAQYIENDLGTIPPESQICTLITGDLPGSSTTPSALLELQSTTGALVVSRMGTSDIEDLHSTNGMIAYDNDIHKMKMFVGGEWEVVGEALPDGGEIIPPTRNNQLASVIASSQGGFGGGSVPLTTIMSKNSGCSVFDMTDINPDCVGFSGGVFDGRYIYFVPQYDASADPSGLVTRFDTYLNFENSSSYEVFDMANNVDASSKGFSSGIFDGQYIYFVPSGALINSGKVTRYNTKMDFTDASSYEVYDMRNRDTNCSGFSSAVFDGRYIYYIPGAFSPAPILTRYDTHGEFNVLDSYDIVDLTSISNPYATFIGGIFDGRYIYLSPFNNGISMDGSTDSGVVVRFDTNNLFSISNFSSFDTAVSGISPNSKGFRGVIFDGTYVYFVPSSGQITRYDTRASFTSTDTSSYKVKNTAAINASSTNFFGASYDGRYIYFCPTGSQITRFDTTGDFTVNGSYSFFDTASSFDPSPGGFMGSISDGRYIYFVPFSSGLLTRIPAYTGPQVTVLTHGI